MYRIPEKSLFEAQIGVSGMVHQGENATVVFRRASDGTTGERIQLNPSASGGFFVYLPRGRYTVTVSAEGYEDRNNFLDIRDGSSEPIHLDLTLEPAGRHQGSSEAKSTLLTVLLLALTAALILVVVWHCRRRTKIDESVYRRQGFRRLQQTLDDDESDDEALDEERTGKRSGGDEADAVMLNRAPNKYPAVAILPPVSIKVATNRGPKSTSDVNLLSESEEDVFDAAVFKTRR